MRRTHPAALVACMAVGLSGTGGAWAAGSEVVASHQGDTHPSSEGFGLVLAGSAIEALNHITGVGIADDLGFPVFAMADATALAGVSFSATPTPVQGVSARVAGFTLRTRLRVVPQGSALPTTPGVAHVGFGAIDLVLRFGANAAPPGGDGSLRVLVEGGPEVVLPGGAVHHLLELVYDPVTNTGDVLADGLEVISDVPAGLGSSFPDLAFGTTLTGTGEVRWNRVELEIQLPDCNDGLDNDGDGLSDLADPGCDEETDLDEADSFACNDGLDDDGDGLVDMADPGCATPTDELEFDLVGAGTPWGAELSLHFEPGLHVGYPDVEMVSTGVVRLGTGPGGVPYLQVPALSGIASASLPTPIGIVDGYQVHASLASGALAVSTAVPANTHPLRGELRLCLILDPTCAAAFSTEPFSTSRGFGAVGLGGSTIYGTGTVLLSEVFHPWTLGTASTQVTTPSGATVVPTRQGFAHGPLSATSTFAQASGVVQWVTPTRVDYFGDVSQDGGTFTSLRVRLLPEPGVFAALASGALLLGVLGIRRARQRGWSSPSL